MPDFCKGEELAMKRTAAFAAAALLALSLAGCAKSAAQEASDSIDSIGEVTLDSQTAIEQAREKYDALSDDEKSKVDNVFVLEDAETALSQAYFAALKRELQTSESLEGNYFTQYYDAQSFKKAQEGAQNAVNQSAKDLYPDVYVALKSENEALSSYIDKETDKSYSAATGLSDEFPFAVDESSVPSQWSFKPATMPTSSNPNWVYSSKKATDLPTYVNLFINGSSRDYTYALAQVPTKEVNVQDENGDVVAALVNTEVQFTAAFDQAANNDPSKEMNERPAYFFIDKKGRTVLALQDYDGEDFYNIYVM